MENPNRTLLTIVGVATILVAIIGASFAYFSANSTSSTQEVTTGKLMLTAASGSTGNLNISPTTFSNVSEAAADPNIAKITLEVVTDGTTISTGKYKITFSTTGIALNTGNDANGDSLVGGSLSDIKWALYDTTDSSSPKGTGTFESGNATDLVAVDNILFPMGNNTDNYILYIWIENTDQPQNKLQELTITATMEAIALQ